jgi:hypothetical protein
MRASHRRASVITSGQVQLNSRADTDALLLSSDSESNPALCKTPSAVRMLSPLRNLGSFSSSVQETQTGSFISVAAVLRFTAARAC